jgi:hypothetical protein
MTKLPPYQLRFSVAVAASLTLSVLLVVTALVQAATRVQGYF